MLEYPSPPGKGRDVNSCLRTGGRASCRWPVECQEQALTQKQACTLGVISGSGGDFLNLVDKEVIGIFPSFTTLTSIMSSNEIIKFPTTIRNRTQCACLLTGRGILREFLPLMPRGTLCSESSYPLE